jgi:hypothetical protein
MASRASAQRQPSDKVIASITKGEGAEVRLSIRQIDGRSYLDVRVFKQRMGEGDVWSRTEEGFTLSISKVDAFVEAVFGLAAATFATHPPSNPGIRKHGGRRR